MLLFMLAQAAAVVAPPSEGVTSYKPDFFAAYRPNNVAEMIARIPGFSLDSGSGVRGYEGAAGNVLIDGQRPATKADTLDQLLYRMPAGSVERIDIIRGGAPGIDMQGKTVIANVVRKAGGAFHGLLAYQQTGLSDGRVYWAARAEGSGKLGPGTWDGGLLIGLGPDGGYGDGAERVVDPHGAVTTLGAIHAQGEAGTFTLNGAVEEPLWGGKLRVNARVATQPYNSDETDSFVLPTVQMTHEHQDDNTVRTELGGRYTHPIGPRSSVEAVLLRQDSTERYADDFRSPGDVQLFRQDTTTAESIARAVVKFQQSQKLSWELGGEVADNTFENRLSFTDNGVDQNLPAANVNVEEKRGELFGKVVWQFRPTITIEGGVREEGSNIASSGDVNHEKTLYYTKPRVLVTWSPDAATQVRFRLERAVGQLDFNAFVASSSLSAGVITVGNPDLVPEQDWVTEAALERRFWGRGSIVVTLRHTDITEAVDRAPVFQPGGGTFDAPANIGDGSKDEISVNLTVPLDKIGLMGGRFVGNYTRRQSEVTDPTTRASREISGLHPQDWDIHFTQDLPGHGLTFAVDLYGQQRERYYRFDVVETRKYGSQLSTNIEWKPRADIAWKFQIDNVFDRSFKRSDDFYAGPRNLAGLEAVQDRFYVPPRFFSIRVRKLFGA